MKKLLLILLIFLAGCATAGLDQRVTDLEEQVLLLQASGVGAATQIFSRDCTGATGDTCTKEMHDITAAVAGDKCLVFNTTDNVYAFYEYVDVLGGSESYPKLIDDENDGGTKGWQLLKGRVDGVVPFSFVDPENLPTVGGRSDRSFPVWCNWTGQTLNIQEIYAWADEDDYDFKLYITSSATDWGTANDTEVDTTAFTISNNGTSIYYGTNPWNSGFEDADVASGQCILFTDVDTSSAGFVYGYIVGYLD